MDEQPTERRALAHLEPVMPLVTPQEAKARWKEYEEFKSAVLTPDDYQVIAGKSFIKRSGFRKMAVFFGLSDEIVKEERFTIPDGGFGWRIIVKVTYPNGRVSTGVGACSTDEKKFGSQQVNEHIVYSTAHTRAKSRAISDMVAGGVVSAEEAEAGEPSPPPTAESSKQSRPAPATASSGQPADLGLEGLPWLPSNATWLPEGTLYIFGDTEGAERLAQTMRVMPNLQDLIGGRLYAFQFGKGDNGPETFINAIPVADRRP